MEGNLILTEFLFFIVYSIGAFVLWEFIKAKDGMLRKIMIVYFAVEFTIYLLASIYFYLSYIKKPPVSPDAFRIIFITPKVCVKIWLLWWLKIGSKK